jgi:hypothetical protein
MEFDWGMPSIRHDFAESVIPIVYFNVTSDAIRNRCERLSGPPPFRILMQPKSIHHIMGGCGIRAVSFFRYCSPQPRREKPSEGRQQVGPRMSKDIMLLSFV